MTELRSYQILDTEAETAYDDITLLASRVSDCPVALITLVDEGRQWFKSRIGLELTETEREIAFCSHAIETPDELMVVPDARSDSRFADNPLVTGEPSIRFYAGAPLVTPKGNALGTLCVIDRQPRELTASQAQTLAALARQVVAQLELRKTVDHLEAQRQEAIVTRAQLEDYQRRLEEANALLQEKCLTDGLTGLRNRQALLEKLDEECARSSRSLNPLSLAMLDIDNFKGFNDQFGHLAGDNVLQRLARLLEQGKRRSDFVARLGGEEFGVVLGDIDPDGAFVVAERIRRTVEQAEWPLRQVTVSVGVATFLRGADGGTALLATADKALYVAKREGRNRVSHTVVEGGLREPAPLEALVGRG